MAARRVTVVSNPATDREVKMYYDPDYREYYNVLYVSGVKQDAATYYTNDREDADSTARHMCGLK